MKILTHFRHFESPDKKIQKYVEEKILKLSRFNKNLMEAHMDIHQGKEQTAPDKYHIYVNLHLPPQNHVLRASAKGSTPQEAVDLVYGELIRQIEKHSHEKRLSRKERKERKIIKRFPPTE